MVFLMEPYSGELSILFLIRIVNLFWINKDKKW